MLENRAFAGIAFFWVLFGLILQTTSVCEAQVSGTPDAL
jgi:hypothetical protein